MQISLNWLRDYVAIEHLSPEEIAATLTSLGLEVEAIESICPIKGDLLAGKIITAVRHPDADKLQLCDVDVGRGEPLRIVCGAANARVGLNVAVAMIGSVLPGDFKIKPSKIRGEKSEGMLCSEKELGFSESHEGIMELPADLPVGTALVDFFGLKDTVLTLGVTPNRADCFGYIGVARDLAAKLGVALKQPEATDIATSGSVTTEANVSVAIENESDCSRFSALYVKNVRPLPSPLWLAKRLEASGMRSINLIVDVTNYVMLESGQPIHAYDERDLAGRTINVRRARPGETLVTLDGIKRVLTPDDLVIADAAEPIGLAGVMGGQSSEVKDDTQNVVIEVAHFHPSLVRRSSKRMGLHTEASHRFERGVDIAITAAVARRVAELLYRATAEVARGGQDVPLPEAAADMIDIYPNPLVPDRIALRLSRARQILGLSILSQDECIGYLEGLGFVFVDKNEDRMVFEVPTWRRDITREIDLIEEVGRLHGFDRIPSRLPLMEIGGTKEKPMIGFLEQAKVAMAELGLNETISFPFVSLADLDRLRLGEDHPFRSTVPLANPLAEDHALMQPTAIVGLLKAIAGNRRHGDEGARLFEVCRVFYDLQKGGIAERYESWRHLTSQGGHINARAAEDERVIERNIVAAILDHPLVKKSWHAAETRASFFDLKAIVLAWLKSFGCREPEFRPVQADAFPWLHPGRAASLHYGDSLLGYIGELHPRTALAYDFAIDKAPIVCELDLDFAQAESVRPKTYETITRRFPPVARDLAFVVDRKTTHDDVVRALSGFKKRRHLSQYSLFDVYQGDKIPADKKSMAYAFSFQSVKKTLVDQEVDAEIAALMEWLKESLDADLRK